MEYDPYGDGAPETIAEMAAAGLLEDCFCTLIQLDFERPVHLEC